MTESEPRQGSRFALTLGLMALFGGLWLFLDTQGVDVPKFKRFWPALLVIGSGASLVDFFKLSRRPSSAGWALAWIGLAILGFALSLKHAEWGRVLDWLPALPTILGLSFLTTYIAGARKTDHLVIAGGVLVGLGLMGFMARFDVLKHIIPSAQVLWAVLLLAGGAFLVWRAVARR